MVKSGLGQNAELGTFSWFCFSGDFLFLALLRYLLGIIFLFFLGFLSKSKFFVGLMAMPKRHLLGLLCKS